MSLFACVMCCRELIKFRKKSPLLGRPDFLSPEDVTWHLDDWDNPESRFLAYTLHDRLPYPLKVLHAGEQPSGNKLKSTCRGQGCGDLYIAFNAHTFSITVDLPPVPQGHFWSRVVDTNLATPKDFTPGVPCV